MAEMMRRRVTAVAATPLVVARESSNLSPAELERRALAQAGEALARGDASEAKALTAVAEQMRRRVEDERTAALAAEEVEKIGAEQNENSAMEFFALVAEIASHMLHQPGSAPAAYLRMVKRWRELNLGEGEEDAEKRAAIVAEAQRAHLDGAWGANLPEDVKTYLDRRWMETRARLAEA